MTHEHEKTLATYDAAGSDAGGPEGGWSPSRFVLKLLLGEGAKSMQATDRRLVVDYGRADEISLHYAPGMLVCLSRVRPPGFLRRLLFRLLCLVCAAVLLLEGYPLSLLAALPTALLAVSAFRDAFVVCLEVSVPIPDKADASIVRALFVAAGPGRRGRLGDFVQRLNRAVADHNAPSSPAAPGAYGLAEQSPLRPENSSEDGVPVARDAAPVLPPDAAPHDLSPRDLLRGVLADGDPEDYEGALLDGLEHETRRLAFSPSPTDDPCRVAGELPGTDRAATSCVFGGPEDAPGREPRAGVLGAFVLDVPESFPHQRYVASYAEAEERVGGAARIRPAGPAAISAWLSDAPVRYEGGEGPLTRCAKWTLVAARGLLDADSRRTVRTWLGAFPGFRPYEPRVRARWRLQPAGSYRVRMNFYEDVEDDDFYAFDGGLRDAYPTSLVWGRAPGSAEGVDLLTGDVTVLGFRDAVEIAERMGAEFAERGVLCDPTVELADPRGYPFELRDNRWPHSAPPAPSAWNRVEDDAGLAAFLSPHDERGLAHVPLSALAATAPSREAAEHALLRADGFARTTNRMAKLRRRLDDPGIPGVRKDVLAMQLAEQRRRHDETLRTLTADPAALVGLLASVERERELLSGVLHHVGRKDAGGFDSFEIRWRLAELERLRRRAPDEEDDGA